MSLAKVSNLQSVIPELRPQIYFLRWLKHIELSNSILTSSRCFNHIKKYIWGLSSGMTDWRLDTYAKLIIVKRPKIFLTVYSLDSFARWVSFWLLPDLLSPEYSKLAISGIVRLRSCGGERGMSSVKRTLRSVLLLGSLVDVMLLNVVPYPSWACSGYTTSMSAPSKSGISHTEVLWVDATSERPLCSPVYSSGLGSSKGWRSRYCWKFGMWVGVWSWVSQVLRTENLSSKIFSDLRSTKSAQFEGTVPFLMCDTVIKWLSKKKETEVRHRLYLD